MACLTTDTPALDEIDIPALKEKYRQERDRRLRSDGQAQYATFGQEHIDYYTSDPFRAVEAREPISEDIDVAILGAGWSGVTSGFHLTQAGMKNFRIIDHAGGFGGCWYWNRYPGVQCDNDSYCYLPLLEETGFIPTKKFSDGFEILDYFQIIADKYDLHDKAIFHTLITSLRWDEADSRWRVSTNRGDEIRARFVMMAGGVLNMPKLPLVPGIGDFKGEMFHTSRWNYDYTGGSCRSPELTKLAGKRVAILGTGATAIQAIPYLAKHAKQLYVLQRTPSCVDERPNPPTDPEWVKTLEPGWQQHRQANFQQALTSVLPGDVPDLICDIWTEINRNLGAEMRAEGVGDLSPEAFMARREAMDFLVMERLRRRVDDVVTDKDTAEALKPYFRFGCKRPLANDNFYPVFNQPNVKLVDVSATQGLERMTKDGFVADGQAYEIDCMILASGFEVTSELKRRWGIEVVEGRNGLSIYDHWANGPETLHGLMTCNFPNMFYLGYIQGGLNGTTTEQFSRQGEHCAYIISKTLEQGHKVAEPDPQAQDEYVRHFREVEIESAEFLNECTPGYFNNEGEGKPAWALLRAYGLGWDAFHQLLKDWRSAGTMPGMNVRRE